MNNSLAQLGKFQFELATVVPQVVQQRSDYSWPVQQRIGTRPAHQFTGIGADNVTLAGISYPGVYGDASHIEALRDIASSGEAAKLIIFNGSGGTIQGDWVIISISSTSTVFDGDGVPRRIDFTINLSRHGGVEAGGIWKDGFKRNRTESFYGTKNQGPTINEQRNVQLKRLFF